MASEAQVINTPFFRGEQMSRHVAHFERRPSVSSKPLSDRGSLYRRSISL